MKTKEKVLNVLHESEGPVSGEQIALELRVSRNSVWKAINSLRSQGYKISASPVGYSLCEMKEFDEYAIKRHLKGEHTLHIYKEESSSSTVAKRLCQEGEGHGAVVIVESQTAGRGRMGRSFLSSSENGLYMSIILRPKISADKCVNITAATAVAVSQAIEETSGVKTGIKWVNDIYVGDKKCAGILTEASIDIENGGVQYVVVGIGVNLCPPKGGFDKEIEEIACGVYEKEYPKGYKARLCAEIINNVFEMLENLEKRAYLAEYKAKSIIIGKDVDVYVGDRVVCGIATDIDENANLIVTDSQGLTYTFNSGEARVRKAEDKRGIM